MQEKSIVDTIVPVSKNIVGIGYKRNLQYSLISQVKLLLININYVNQIIPAIAVANLRNFPENVLRSKINRAVFPNSYEVRLIFVFRFQ